MRTLQCVANNSIVRATEVDNVRLTVTPHLQSCYLMTSSVLFVNPLLLTQINTTDFKVCSVVTYDTSKRWCEVGEDAVSVTQAVTESCACCCYYNFFLI